MITPRKTDTRSNLLDRHANAIYAAIQAAEADGYVLDLKHGWALDLKDKDTNEWTPVIGVLTSVSW